MLYDIVIRNGTVIDGSGRPGVQADVALQADRIVTVGDCGGETRQTLDATGCIVAPGFIDVHSHDDFAVLDRPECDFKIMQGVTTEVVGNCGFGAAPANAAYRDFLRGFGPLLFGPMGRFDWETTEEFYQALEARPAAVNVASLVPHAAVRYGVLPDEKREPSAHELRQMRDLVREGLEAGAVGLSTGLFYAPGRYAQTEEVVALAQVVAEYDGVYASHMRDEAEHLLDSIKETVRIGEEAGVAVQISHHKVMGRRNWGNVNKSLALLEQARTRGLAISSDAYPYTAGSTTLAALVQGGVLERSTPSDVLIASTPSLHEYEGKTLEEICQLTGKSLQETVTELLAGEGASTIAVIFGMDETDVRRVLAHPTTMIGSDGIPSVEGKPHPRLYGTFARILGKYVRETGLLTLEDAVHRMTGLSAEKFHLTDRGLIRAGAYADIVVFDPHTIADVGTYQEPRRYPPGVSYVVVNGRTAVDRGQHTGVCTGRLLRHRPMG